MKTRILIQLILSTFIIASCNNSKADDSFVLNGIVKNAKKDDVILLRVNNKTVDSTAIQNDKFSFEGSFEQPTKALLFIKNSRDYHSLWLENAPMSITGQRGDFKNATVTGSKTQDENNQLKAKLAYAESRWSEVNNLLMRIPKDDKRRDSLTIIFDKFQKVKDTISQNFVRKHPNSLVSLESLAIYKFRWGKPITASLFSKMNDSFKKSEKGLAISSYLETPISPKIGEKYIDFAQPDANGKQIKVSDIAKKYTLIEFWGAHCAPCRKANPKLVEIYRKYNKKGFEIIGVSHDSDKEDWLKAVKKDKLPWTNVSELKGDNNNGANIYEVSVIPDNVLFDENGIIVARKIKVDELNRFLMKNL